MSPLRRWMSDHGHPSWYSWLVVIGACFTSLLISVTISISTTRHMVEREEQARLQGEQALCGVIYVLDDAYRQVPPTTPAGKQVAKAIADERARRCPPTTVKDGN